ncbi:MAG TPA: HDIG domain-containing protein [Thermodesulfovibrionales bacterium]|nr:HDIG domain-containing protein [Thermodesulfovibrionales bacterium]
MKGTKNGVQIVQKPQTEITPGRKYSLLLVLSLLTAFAVQVRIGVESLIGGFLVACMLLSILYRDILRYKPQYMKKFSMLVLLGLLILATVIFGRVWHYVLLNLSKGFGSLSIHGAVYGMPIAAGAMLVTLLFDFHTAIFFSFIVSILSGLWLSDAVYPLYAFVGSLTAAFSVIRCKKRSALLKGGFFVGGANTFTAVVLLLFQGYLFTDRAISTLLFAMSTSVSVTAVVSLLLPFLEYTFNVTTDISLLELLDLNQPLMKNLMINAPGTYHHSVIVGNLAESAAEAVGVNPLLTRVSAYYHDIGKIKMPEYFVENHSGAVSRHDKLTPHMSAMIICSHVKEGVELLRHYKLPQSIIDITQQHHGTSLMTYFYQKAKDHDSGNQLSEDEYRYSGPKPQTRVAALVMMADAVEAASRVLTDPTPARISALVDKIINHIFLEGQLDECELTLKDISEVRSHFSYILTGILHKRVDYPGFDFSEGPKKEPRDYERGAVGEPHHTPGVDEGSYKESPKAHKDKPQESKKGLPETSQIVQP